MLSKKIIWQVMVSIIIIKYDILFVTSEPKLNGNNLCICKGLRYFLNGAVEIEKRPGNVSIVLKALMYLSHAALYNKCYNSREL